MKRLEMIKGEIVQMPEQVKRYICVVWSEQNGWSIWNGYRLFTTPEDATQDLLQSGAKGDYYTVVELNLKIPVIS